MKKTLSVILTLFFANVIIAQETFPVNGTVDKDHQPRVFIHATLHIDAATTIEDATLLILDGKVIASGKEVAIPKDAIITDCSGKHIYPSFIDLVSEYGMSQSDSPHSGDKKQEGSAASSWNQAIHPEARAANTFIPDPAMAESYRAAGFGSVLTHQLDGIMRGTSALVNLSDESANQALLLPMAANHLSFNKGKSKNPYPSSLMGSIALIRQTYYDAVWYASNRDRNERNISLEAINDNAALPIIFHGNGYLDVLAADKIADEFGKKFIIRGGGDEYRRIDEIKTSKAPLIIPVNFPLAFDVSDPYANLYITTTDLKHWELAPFNPTYLHHAGVQFAITADGLDDKSGFLKQLRKAVDNGLPEEEALKALTAIPAALVGAEKILGALKPGMHANFILADGPVFSAETQIIENWVGGKKYAVSTPPNRDIRGSYTIALGSSNLKLEITGTLSEPELKSGIDTAKTKGVIRFRQGVVDLTITPADTNVQGTYNLVGSFVEDKISGNGTAPDGTWINWSALRVKPFVSEPAKKDKKISEPGSIWYPLTAYGLPTIEQPKKTLIRNATIWTNESEGILSQSDILLDGGKIIAIGKNLSDAGALIVDGKDKHVTCGIIDEHSHIGIRRGVNEGAQAITSEVRIGDVTNPDDVNIYRQLAGGVTAAQSLHGSANPIGGQSAIIKLRWGRGADDYKIAGADGFIKFALGENVKQSNWGPGDRDRFPQTRMGVEQVFFDAFIRAAEYDKKMKDFQLLGSKPKVKVAAPRRDLELEALAEILNEKRFISCHSYVQSEINMLMKVADSLNFKINTFTHILEGYKVASQMKAHGAGASTFSDWWAYKFEVYDAIPYNGAMLHNKGIVTAFNSDDAEMGRRLNQEAAKAVKYGGVSEEDAWKFVTLNPARLLHLDKQMGSLKVGKDADVVVWSNNPLSISAKVEQTFVDGVLLYSTDKDDTLRKSNETERARIIRKMAEAKKNGEEVRKPKKKEQPHYHCETTWEE